MLGGTTRNNLAAFNPDGTLSAWDPNANGEIYALAVNGSAVYAGGVFTSIKQLAMRLAAINTDGSLSTGIHPMSIRPLFVPLQ